MEQQIKQAAKLIKDANNVVAMTGAGISTPSGIPDFRSPSSGLWDNTDPMAVASIAAFRRNPQLFYDWIRPVAGLFADAKPNPAHYALADLERVGKIKAVITQNIDGLHSQAGSKTVYELHGHIREVICVKCHALIDSAAILSRFVQDGEIPIHHCGGVLKPNVVLFGEPLPAQELVSAQLAAREADLILVAGSSLEVSPASDLPAEACAAGAKLIIINHQPTHLDKLADLVIQADIAEILPRVVKFNCEL